MTGSNQLKPTRAVGAALAFVLYIIPGLVVVAAPVFGLALAIAPCAFITAYLLRRDALTSRMDYPLIQGTILGAIASGCGGWLYSVVAVLSSQDATQRSPFAVLMFLLISSISLWIFSIIPAALVGIVWAFALKRGSVTNRATRP